MLQSCQVHWYAAHTTWATDYGLKAEPDTTGPLNADASIDTLIVLVADAIIEIPRC